MPEKYIDNDLFNLLRVWAVTTEQLLAFDPDAGAEWFARAAECAKDPALWPAEHRAITRDAAVNGDLMRGWYREEFATGILNDQRALFDARAEVDDADDPED